MSTHSYLLIDQDDYRQYWMSIEEIPINSYYWSYLRNAIQMWNCITKIRIIIMLMILTILII